MSPLYVRLYVKVHKNDDRDAEAIAGAATRPTMSFVAIKPEEQLDLQALHRAGKRLVTERTRLCATQSCELGHDREAKPSESGLCLDTGGIC